MEIENKIQELEDKINLIEKHLINQAIQLEQLSGQVLSLANLINNKEETND